LSLDSKNADIPVRNVSHVLISNWNMRYFYTQPVKSLKNKFVFASFQGKSHDKEISMNEKSKQKKMNKIQIEEEKIESKENNGIKRRTSEVY